MSNELDVGRQEAMETYMAINRGLRESYNNNIRIFGNQILALSAGTLGLSLTFVSNLVDLQAASSLWLLIVSWALLAAAILSVLFGLRFATRSKTVRETLDAGEQFTGLGNYKDSGPDPDAAMTRAWTKDNRIDLYNKLSVWFFVCGLAAMIIFVSVNVLFETAVSATYPR